MRFGCDDDGYPKVVRLYYSGPDIYKRLILQEKKEERKSPKNVVKKTDINRAEEKVPRDHFKGE